MTAGEIIAAVQAVGGRIWLEGGLLHSKLPQRERSEGGLLPELRRRRGELLHHLTKTAPPPVCPVHGGQALWWSRQEGDSVCGLCHPDPFAMGAKESAQNEPPIIPVGVTLLAWEPREPPVVLSTHSVVNDTRKFIEITLQQLDAALRGNCPAAGNWTMRDLCERLEQVGMRVKVAEKSEHERAPPSGKTV